jgi:steroid delta-isomerase-like uncharacterized protein
MSTEDNKANDRRALEEFNQGNVAAFFELFAPNFINHDPGAPWVRTLEDYKQWAIELRNAFPDCHLTIDDLIAEGDQVVVRWTFSGTNTGDMVTPMPIPATGKQVTITGITIDRFAGGKLVETWQHGDTMGFMQQLGLAPAPGQAS